MVIEYECPACEDDGVVHGWRGTYRDITGFLDADDPGNVLCGIAPAEYEQARKVITLARGSEAIVHGAIYVNGEVVLAASPNDMALFSEEVAAAANHATNRRAEQLLDSLWDKLEAAVEDQQEIERREEVMRELASETERPGLYK